MTTKTQIVLAEQLLGALNEIDRLQGQLDILTAKATAHEDSVSELQEELSLAKFNANFHEKRVYKLIELCKENNVSVPVDLELPF